MQPFPRPPRRPAAPPPRRPWKRNDAAGSAAAEAALAPKLIAHAQFNLSGVGWFGVGVFEGPDKRHARADFYRHAQGGQWDFVTAGTFDLGRLWLATVPPVDPEDYQAADVVRGLNQALLVTPFGRERVARITASSLRFHGERPPAGPLADPTAEATRRMLARTSCAGTPPKGRKGPDPKATARAMFESLCFSPDGTFEPAWPGGGCDQLLGAVRGTAPPPCEVGAGVIDCPRRGSSEDIAMARQSGARPPYETTRAHEPGSIPCCWYHPITQARLQLHREVRARVMAQPGSTAVDAERAITEAEAAHPLRPQWDACDELAERESNGDMVMNNRAGNLGHQLNRDHMMSLYIAAYHALENNDPRTTSYLAALAAEEPRLWEFSADSDPAQLLEYAHDYAHETGNAAYVTWTHVRMKRGNSTGAIACTFTQRAQASRSRYRESMKAARPPSRKK